MRTRIFTLGALLVLSGLAAGIFLISKLRDDPAPIQIDVWYGDQQHFGHLGGHPQRWINILGNVYPAHRVTDLSFTLNGGSDQALSFREDKKRIARPGDFNAEILRSELKPGLNTVTIVAKGKSGELCKRIVNVTYVEKVGRWPMPYSIDWSEASRISDVAQVVDGKWRLTPKGVRSVERHYDRVITFGDETWENYEVATSVTFHSFTGPNQGPNSTTVTHAAISSRWPGHEADGNQPSIKWFPMGATAEFRIGHDLQKCRWRIFDGKKEFHVESEKRRAIELEKTYNMRHTVETLPDGRSRYRAKLWPAGETEPDSWDLERFETGDLRSGSALLVAHHTEVTFGDVKVIPIEAP